MRVFELADKDATLELVVDASGSVVAITRDGQTWQRKAR